MVGEPTQPSPSRFCHHFPAPNATRWPPLPSGALLSLIFQLQPLVLLLRPGSTRPSSLPCRASAVFYNFSVMKLEKQEVLEWDGVAYKKAWAERDK